MWQTSAITLLRTKFHHLQNFGISVGAFGGLPLFTLTKLGPASLPQTTLKLGRTILDMEAVQRGCSDLAGGVVASKWLKNGGGTSFICEPVQKISCPRN